MISPLTHKSPWLKTAGVILILLVLSVGMTFPILFHDRALMLDSGAGGDAFIFLWNFWWTKHALVDLHTNPYFTPLLYHPHGTSLALHTYPMIYSLISVPLQCVIGGLSGLIMANNTIVILSFFLAGVGMYLLAQYCARNRAAALLAAIFYAYANFRFANTVRLHCLSTEWLPFYVLFLLRWARTGRPREAVGSAVFLAAILYSSLEYFTFSLLLTPIFVAGFWLFGARRYRLNNLCAPKPLCVFAAVAICLGLPLLVQLLPQVLTERHVLDLQVQFSADVLDFFLPNPRHPIWGGLSRPITGKFHGGDEGFGMSISCVGWAYLALYMVLWIRRRGRPLAGMWPLGIAVCLCLALGPRLHTAGTIWNFSMPYDLLMKALPLLRASRCPMRWVAFAQMFMAVAIALAAAWMLRRRTWPARTVFGLSIAVMLFEQLSCPMPMTRIKVPEYYPEMAKDDLAGCVLHFPLGFPAIPGRLDLLYQTVHGKPLAWYLLDTIPHTSRRSFASLKHGELQRFWMAVQQSRAGSMDPVDWDPEPLARAFFKRFRPSYIILLTRYVTVGQSARAQRCFQQLGPSEIRRYADAVVFVYGSPRLIPKTGP